jgi:hypothetical protein
VEVLVHPTVLVTHGLILSRGLYHQADRRAVQSSTTTGRWSTQRIDGPNLGIG